MEQDKPVEKPVEVGSWSDWDPTPVEEVVLKCARTKDGKPLAVKVKFVDAGDISLALETVPTAPDPDGAKDVRTAHQKFVDNAVRTTAVCKLGLVEPKFAFEPGEPGPSWEMLGPVDRGEIFEGILRVSGWSEGRTAALQAFPDGDAAKRGKVRVGGSVRGGDGAGVPDGSPAPIGAAVS